MPKLLISLPSGDVSKELSGDVITIGRTPDNKVQIDHHSVSAHHARLVLHNGNYKIKDLDSTNRSCVNGIPISDAELTGSCFLRFGTIECVFKSDAPTANDQLHSQLDELQRQMGDLIKARDLIAQHNVGLAKERDQAKLEADNAVDQLNDVKKQLQKFSESSTGHQQQLQEITGQLNDARKQIETLSKQRDALGKECDTLSKECNAIGKEREQAKMEAGNNLNQLNDVKRQLQTFSESSTGNQQQLQEISGQLNDARKQIESLGKERDQAKMEAGNNLDQLNDVKRQLQTFSENSTGNQQQLQEISGQLDNARKQIESLSKERDAFVESNKELKTQIETLALQLKELQQKAAQPAPAAPVIPPLAAPVIQQQVSPDVREKAAASVKADMDESVDEDFEEQELAAVGQRTSVAGGVAGRIISGAPLIGSWLNRGTGVKIKTGPLGQPEQPSNLTTLPSQTEAKNGGLGNVVITSPASLRLVSPSQQPNGHNANLGSPAVKIGRASANVAPQNPAIKPAWDLLNVMRRSLHYFLRHQDELKVLQEMTENAHSFTEMAREGLLRPVLELAAALESLMADLHANPANINPSTLRTVGQSIDFLATLIDEANLGRIKDVTTAKVFAIDDDEGILETIKATMEMANLNVATSLQSNTGLNMLSEQNYDLILLDVGIPEMSGMDICSRVRAMPHHQKTPIVFLTGEATVQNRVQSTLNGGNDMIGKPFSILELAVKAITWIFKGQLGLV